MRFNSPVNPRDKSWLNRGSQRFRAILFVSLFAVAGAVYLIISYAASNVYTPMTSNEHLIDNGQGAPDYGLCISTDDQLDWAASGSLKPGESFSFTPSKVTCPSEIGTIAAKVSWDSSKITMTSAAPAADGVSDDTAQTGRPVAATTVGQTAYLCMFTTGAKSNYNYTIKLTNTGNQTAYTVNALGFEADERGDLHDHKCDKSDADHDFWNDTLEYNLANFTAHANDWSGGYIYSYLVGSNYLRPSASTSYTNDESDSSPADFNDDGVVNQTDVDILSAQLGKGNGVPIDQTSANETDGANYFFNNTRSWRRYDIDGDGYVTSYDVDWVKRLVGKPIPMASDVLPPRVALLPPITNGSTVSKGTNVLIPVYAFDNSVLAKFEVYVGGKLLTSCYQRNWEDGAHDTSAAHYCWWNVPRKRGATYSVYAKAYDQAGNASTTPTISVNAQ